VFFELGISGSLSNVRRPLKAPRGNMNEANSKENHAASFRKKICKCISSPGGLIGRKERIWAGQ